MFTLDIQLGHFLLIVFIIAELLISPLRNLFAAEILYCAARHVVAKGRQVHVRPAPKLCHAFALEKTVLSKGILIPFVSTVKIIILILFIASVALWERTIEAETVQLTVELDTTSDFEENFSVPQGKTILVSSFPVIGLSEEEAGPLKPFSINGTDSNAQYKVRENIELASQYTSACVKTPNSTYTIVSIAALIIDHNGHKKTSCLDGSGASSTLIAATFKTDLDEDEDGREVRTMEFLREISTDNTSTLYAARISDDNGDSYTGYVAVTLRSYFHANVHWSVYGLLRSDTEGGEVWRLSLPLKSPSGHKPCYQDEIGTWEVNESYFKCPTGKPIDRYENPEEVRTKALTTAGLLLKMQQTGNDNSDLLAWMVETDYARFFAARTFAGELRERARSDRMFYSAFEGRRVVATSGLTKESVSFAKRETILVAVAISLLVLQILVGIIWRWTQVRKYNMRSDIFSYEAVVTMLRRHVSGLDIDDGRPVLSLGISNCEEGSQYLGIVSKGESVARDSKKPWGNRMDSEDYLNDVVIG